MFYDILKGEDNLQFNGQPPFFAYADISPTNVHRFGPDADCKIRSLPQGRSIRFRQSRRPRTSISRLQDIFLSVAALFTLSTQI